MSVSGLFTIPYWLFWLLCVSIHILEFFGYNALRTSVDILRGIAWTLWIAPQRGWRWVTSFYQQEFFWSMSTAYFPLDYVGLTFFHPSLAVPWEQVLPSWVRWTPRYFLSVNVTVSVFDTCFLILSVCCECWKYKRFLFPFFPVHLSEPPGRTGLVRVTRGSGSGARPCFSGSQCWASFVVLSVYPP